MHLTTAFVLDTQLRLGTVPDTRAMSFISQVNTTSWWSKHLVMTTIDNVMDDKLLDLILVDYWLNNHVSKPI